MTHSEAMSPTFSMAMRALVSDARRRTLEPRGPMISPSDPSS